MPIKPLKADADASGGDTNSPPTDATAADTTPETEPTPETLAVEPEANPEATLPPDEASPKPIRYRVTAQHFAEWHANDEITDAELRKVVRHDDRIIELQLQGTIQDITDES